MCHDGSPVKDHSALFRFKCDRKDERGDHTSRPDARPIEGKKVKAWEAKERAIEAIVKDVKDLMCEDEGANDEINQDKA
jgi:hypothetical protein